MIPRACACEAFHSSFAVCPMIVDVRLRGLPVINVGAMAGVRCHLYRTPPAIQSISKNMTRRMRSGSANNT